MKTIVYSPTSRDKLLHIKEYLDLQFGKNSSEKTVKELISHINQLTVFEYAGESVRELFGIDADYRVLFASHNYVFYRVNEAYIYIVNIYHEREDFMQKLFGINTMSEDHFNEDL